MYSNLKSVQYLVAMLEKKGVKNIVISAGTSHDAIVRTIENDNFFKTYNIVDERSAAFFALGLIQELNQPVAIISTSGTATVNYLSGATEAYYRKMPLIIITADKNPYYLNQKEDQMINQKEIFNNVIKHSVTLPIVNNSKDEWYCKRLINEALLEMNHHGIGPVHINVPIEEGMFAIDEWFTTSTLPKINLIERININTPKNKWKEKFDSLKGKKVLIIYGQDYNINETKIKNLEKVFDNYNCVISVDKLSNIHCKGALELSRATLAKKSSPGFSELIPDLIIFLAGNVVWDGKGVLKKYKKEFDTWIVTEEGEIQDLYRNLSTIFECKTEEFLEEMSKHKVEKSNLYYETWKKNSNEFKMPNFEYSNLYVTQKLMNNIPKNSILNLANSTTIRIAQYFYLDNSVKVFCNRGVHGIDGCMSTFIGQSAITDRLSFLIIGDLTFFYDMNALWNRYLGKNIRILLVNNSGASLFHFNQGLKKFPTLNENVAAEHDATAKGWVESRGFKYLCSHTKEEFDNAIEEFISEKSEQPIILEVFTKKEEDAKLQHEFFEFNLSNADKIKIKSKKTIKRIVKNTIKKVK